MLGSVLQRSFEDLLVPWSPSWVLHYLGAFPQSRDSFEQNCRLTSSFSSSAEVLLVRPDWVGINNSQCWVRSQPAWWLSGQQLPTKQSQTFTWISLLQWKSWQLSPHRWKNSSVIKWSVSLNSPTSLHHFSWDNAIRMPAEGSVNLPHNKVLQTSWHPTEAPWWPRI